MVGGDIVENIFPEFLVDLLIASVVFSIILMALIQKFKSLDFITKSWQVWSLDLFLSFAIGLPFGITFYDFNWKESLWIGLFSFIGATGIYKTLKSQNIINYKPASVSDTIELPKQNEIVRDDK